MSKRFPDGMSVRTKTLAVRMYGYASAREWNLTIPELAALMGESVDRVRRVSQLHNWSPRFRACALDAAKSVHTVTAIMDAHLDEMAAR